MMTMPTALRAGAIAIISSVGASLTATSAFAGPVVLELFTSQGCSSCPPADSILGQYYVNRDDVIALSLAVDYWNYLGWEDTFAQHAHSERQYAYATARGDGQVYTPQMVVDGLWHVIGSDRSAIDAAIAEAQNLPSVDMAIVPVADGLQVEVGDAVAGAPTWGALWLVMFDDAATVDITRGENAGRTVTYHHIVLGMHGLAMWRGQAMTIELPMMEMSEVGADGVAVILQQNESGLPGQVMGAAAYDIN
jgi:hypothetical protein